jgi:hypothetical protein
MVIQSKLASVLKELAEASSGSVVLTVQRSLLPYEPEPWLMEPESSVMHAPLPVTWQYCEPDTTDQ